MNNNEFYRLIVESERAASHKPSHFEMDEAFSARMRAAIAAGLESAPTSVITMPGTRKPKYVSDLTAKYHRPRKER
jgi:hypothetical protein